MIAESVSSWEKERLFSTDLVLIAMGLAEAVTFPTIPVKVTMNEYVEISKFYGTPKSRSFVNGLLDKLVQKLTEEGQIKKEGKGLL
jgi:N utilization substance protein B